MSDVNSLSVVGHWWWMTEWTNENICIGWTPNRMLCVLSGRIMYDELFYGRMCTPSHQHQKLVFEENHSYTSHVHTLCVILHVPTVHDLRIIKPLEMRAPINFLFHISSLSCFPSNHLITLTEGGLLSTLCLFIIVIFASHAQILFFHQRSASPIPQVLFVLVIRFVSF